MADLSIDTVLGTLRADPWVREDATVVASRLFDVVVQLIGDEMETPITYAGILNLQKQLYPHAREVTGAISIDGRALSADGRQLLNANLTAGEQECARRLEIALRYSEDEDVTALLTYVLKFHDTIQLFVKGRWHLTYAQLLGVEYGALIRPVVAHWSL